MTHKKCADAVRILSMDGVQKAASGHPGAPMGMADMAEVLWRNNLRHNPGDPKWINRDRFALSNGHASMMLYSLLHLSGYDLSLEDLKQFRQFGSKTAGHPEIELISGVETTTGPLGQGLANAVGMALAEKVLAANFNKDGFPLIDHYTYAFAGDGCLMEGLSHEACSYAGTLKLGKLILFYDDNGISIDGKVDPWFTEDVPARFKAYGWHVVEGIDGHNHEALQKALDEGKAATDRPTIICCKTIIGFGSPAKQGTSSCHGAPLGADEVMAARKSLGWESEELFYVPDDIYKAWNGLEKGEALQKEWNALFASYKKAFPELAAELERRLKGEFPSNWKSFAEKMVADFDKEGASVASRKASQMVLEKMGPVLPELLGGSADLTPSNLTNWSGSKSITGDDAAGNYLSYGVREFAMSAIMNGAALHGGFIPYGGTFLVFNDYAKNAIRMAALMKLRSIFVYTHDSIGVGEDGPTHQPVEQIATMRLIPGLDVWRPCDTVETAVSWKSAIERADGPSSLIFTRQGLKHLEHQKTAEIEKGAYVIYESSENPEFLIIATGSEVAISVDAAKKLAEEGKAVRVVSMPCMEVFLRQSEAYIESVIPASVRKRVVVEAASTEIWYRFAGLDGRIIGMESFGKSAPANILFEHFGFTTENIIKVVKELS